MEVCLNRSPPVVLFIATACPNCFIRDSLQELHVSVTTFTQEEQSELRDPWEWVRFQFFPGGVLGITALAMQWPSGHLGWQIGWTLFTAYCMFCWTSCFHECAHQTLGGSRFWSLLIGRGLGTVMFLPYSIYRESHIRHHAYLNKPHDWELWPYSDPNASLWFRRVFVWVDFFAGMITAPYTFGRLFFHRDSPLTDPKLRRTIQLEYAIILVFWTTLFTTLSLTGTWMFFVRGWLIPLALTGMWQNARKFTEHLGMQSYDPMLGTRTVVGANWLTRACTYLNFDIFIHGPHHRHPRVAHRTLRKKMHEYAEKAPELKYPMFGSYWAAIADTVPYLFKNPGVGMNAGAPAPKAEKKQVENFVVDVSAEVLSEDDRIVREVVEMV